MVPPIRVYRHILIVFVCLFVCLLRILSVHSKRWNSFSKVLEASFLIFSVLEKSQARGACSQSQPSRECVRRKLICELYHKTLNAQTPLKSSKCPIQHYVLEAWELHIGDSNE